MEENDSSLKKNNNEFSNFDPTFISNGQEMIFTLKDTNVLDMNDDINNNINNKNNLQIEDIKYSKDTGIAIERYDENENVIKNEKEYLEVEDNVELIDENFLLNKFEKIQKKAENKQNLNKNKKFQEEFYNEEELKLLNKKKSRKKKNAMVIFDIDINDNEEKKESNEKVNDDEKNDIIDKSGINKNNDKKSLFTLEDKEKLDNLFNSNKKKKNNENIMKKNIINIDENFLEEEGENNNDNGNNDNIRINKDKNYKILDDYAIFLDNLPNPKNTEKKEKEKEEEINKKEKDKIETNTVINNNNINNKELDTNINLKEENDNNSKKEEINEDIGDDDVTVGKDEEDNNPIITEPIIGKGVCVALQIFRNKKMLKNEEEFGRYHDKKYENITNEVNEEKGTEYDNNTLNIKDKNEYYKHKTINIEYRDENGKKLRPKEMARYQALIFHGAKSSVRKREKKLLREKYQVFVQNPTSNKTINYMNFMKDKNHQAFATLQGKSSFL